MNGGLSRLYRWLLYPLLISGLRLASLFNGKIRRGLEMRRPIDGRPPWLNLPPGLRPVWIHCASGEFEYAKPVIRQLKDQHPDLKILVTYFSPSAQKSVASFPGVDLHCPSPYDEPQVLQAFLEHHKPVALLLARTDTWPEMLRQTALRGIPSLLFSATLATGRSGRTRGLARPLTRWMLQNLTHIFCVTDEDAAAFADLGVGTRTTVAGDTRYDQTLYRLSHPKSLREGLRPSVRENVLVAGSTWEEDERELLPLIAALGNRMRFVLAPHEPTTSHLEHLEKALRARGLTAVRYSQSDSWPDGAVLLIDQVGILAELYTWGNFAFVGGSFRKTVHSVMEPLAAGCLTFVGPLHENNREALEFKVLTLETAPTLSCVEAITSASHWQRRLEEALSSLQPSSHEEIRAQIRKRSGRSQIVLRWLESKVPSLQKKATSDAPGLDG